jgi:hypothetical protein
VIVTKLTPLYLRFRDDKPGDIPEGTGYQYGYLRMGKGMEETPAGQQLGNVAW